MRLSELTAYAAEKYGIVEQKKWETFSGFSVLADSKTNDRLAILMREWNYETGEEIEFCDMKCGMENVPKQPDSYLSAPFRMRGNKWVGIRFNDNTEADTVFGLFDKAVELNRQSGFMITLSDSISGGKYHDTPLSFEHMKGCKGEHIPQKILDMQKLYEYGDVSFKNKVKNFRRQAKFMEDYEDDMPWEGDFRHYFPTYHDLNHRQLRGYFTWRTGIRKGNYSRISESAAYIYIYELLNGIGAVSVSDSLDKMKEFEEKYIDSGIGDESIRKNLRKWMLELAVINGIEADKAVEYADVEMMETDRALAALRNPDSHDDEIVFKALCTFNTKLPSSVVLKKQESEGIHLFAAVWRNISEEYEKTGRNLFEECFGNRHSYRWSPLLNAVYLPEKADEPITYVLNECREYSFNAGVWKEKAYQKLYFNKIIFDGLIRETDRKLREYLNTGYALGRKNADSWAEPYINVVIENDRKLKEEAARPKVSIRFESLDKIRQDAYETMDSLLTAEERQVLDEGILGYEKPKLSKEELDLEGKELNFERELKKDTQSKEAALQLCEKNSLIQEETEQMPEKIGQAMEDNRLAAEDDNASNKEGSIATLAETHGINTSAAYAISLNETERQILTLLLADKPVKGLISEKHLLPEVIADRLNEAFFDEIGDTTVECDLETITLVPEYKEDIGRIIRGETDE